MVAATVSPVLSSRSLTAHSQIVPSDAILLFSVSSSVSLPDVGSVVLLSDAGSVVSPSDAGSVVSFSDTGSVVSLSDAGSASPTVIVAVIGTTTAEGL